ncbi:MAG: hypothetical protein RR362_03920 [Raoultibacter sp.]
MPIKQNSYFPDEKKMLEDTMSINPDGLIAKKLMRIGVDIKAEQEEAKIKLDAIANEQRQQIIQDE